MYTGSGDITRAHIGAEGDLEEGALATLLKVVAGVEDLTRAVLPREELTLCADPGGAALQVTLPEFDAQGLVERPGRRNPGIIQIPGVDEEAGSGQQTGGRQQVGGRDAVGNKQQAGRRDAAGSSQQAGRRDAVGSGSAAQGDKGKCPRAYLPQPSSSSSPSPPRPRPAVGGTTEGGRGAQSRAREPKDQGLAGGATAGVRTNQPSEAGSNAAPQWPEGQSPPPKRRKADPGSTSQGLGFKIPESRWQYHGPKSM
ncbi:uncharacterized protein LOC133904508 [Phragmites australis]|uniref:uncharacterized protein LOC133904508 n=1 Tax=Phragmites australis TaxID=29695 RepID=UPI002D795DA8|nr:uncharacterized protein LOC133904508 [Phragmites australis]